MGSPEVGEHPQMVLPQENPLVQEPPLQLKYQGLCVQINISLMKSKVPV
jgi:hypothetical protein